MSERKTGEKWTEIVVTECEETDISVIEHMRELSPDDVIAWCFANPRQGWKVLVALALAKKLVGPAGKWNFEDHCDRQCRDTYRREVTTERAEVLRNAGLTLVDSEAPVNTEGDS